MSTDHYNEIVKNFIVGAEFGVLGHIDILTLINKISTLKVNQLEKTTRERQTEIDRLKARVIILVNNNLKLC